MQGFKFLSCLDLTTGPKKDCSNLLLSCEMTASSCHLSCFLLNECHNNKTYIKGNGNMARWNDRNV